jgi:repressor LexA
MSNIGQKIKQRRLSLEMTQEELAFKMGYKSKSTINKIELGINDIPQSKIVQFAKVLQTSIAFLMDWEDDTSPPIPQAANIEPLPRFKKIPLVGTIACGEPILADQNIEDYVLCPANINADFSLRCKGDSMIGARIHDGDIVYIRQQPDVENGEIAAVLIEDEATLKRVYKKGSSVILQPENPAYEPLVFVREEINQIRVLGKAVCFLSSVK